MAEIKKEIPAGPINGSNKSFTLANAPYQIDDVFMDGAVYVTFSVVGQVITLADAPTVSLFVDYSTSAPQTGGSETVDLDAIQTEVYSLMGQKANSPSSTTFSPERVKGAINHAVEQVCRGRVTNLLNPGQILRAGRLEFMELDSAFRHVTPQRLAAPFAVGDDFLTVSAPGFPDSGAVLVGGEVFTYSGKTDTELVGVAGGTIAHLATESVSFLHPFPAQAEKPRGFRVSSTSGLSAELPYDGTASHFSGYSIVISGTSKYLLFSNVSEGALVTGTFHKKLFKMEEPTDLCPIPGDYGLTVIAPLVSGTYQYNYGMPNAQQNLATAYANLQNMYQFFVNDTVVQRQAIKPQPYGFASMASSNVGYFRTGH